MKTPDLSVITILEDMSAAQREALANYGTVVEIAPGAKIFSQGTQTQSLFFVLTGKVGVYATDPHGGQVHLRTIERGGHFGEVGWLRAAARTANVRAILKSTLFKLEGAALEDLMRSPEVAAPLLLALGRSLAFRLADSTSRMTELWTQKDFWVV